MIQMKGEIVDYWYNFMCKDEVIVLNNKNKNKKYVCFKSNILKGSINYT